MGIKAIRFAIVFNAIFCLIVSFMLMGHLAAQLVLMFFNLMIYFGLRHALKKAVAAKQMQTYNPNNVKQWN